MDPSSLFGFSSGDGGGGSSFLWSIGLGIVGMAYFSYGKKLSKPVPLGCGVALMVFPYFVSSTAWLLGIGGVLSAVPFVVKN
jgi:hypothetical protein